MHRSAQGGFTLIETLVALAIFAMIGAAAYQVLGSVMRADAQTAARSAELRRLNRALWQLQQDLEQMARRPVRTTGDQREGWLVVDADATLPLKLTRAGRGNPLGLPRSSLQRVAWRVGPHPDHEQRDSPHYGAEDLYLLRYSWSALDGAQPDDALIQVALDEVDQLAVIVVSERGEYRQWPPPRESGADSRVPEPTSVVVELSHSRWGDLQRRYRVL